MVGQRLACATKFESKENSRPSITMVNITEKDMRRFTKLVFNIKTFILLSVLATNSFATTAALTGKCGGTMQMQRKLFASKEYDGKTVDAMIHIDFDTNTFSLQSHQISLPSNFPNGEPSYVFTEAKSAPMNITAGKIPSSYRIDIPNFKAIMYVMRVNGGNSFLIQGYNDHMSGVCQKI
jgi:hypothetical protein